MAKKVDYSVILNKSDRIKKVKMLTLKGKNFAEDFRVFVNASLLYWVGEGTRQVQPLNDLLDIAYATRGMNASKLADWLVAGGVCHKLEETVKGSGIWQFKGKKKDEVYLTEQETKDWLAKNPDWSEFYKNAAPKFADPKLDKIKNGFLVQVARGLSVGTISPEDIQAFAQKLLDEAKEKVNDEKVVEWVEHYKEAKEKKAA